MARKVENIVFNIKGRDIPLYPCWGSTFSTKINIEKGGEIILRKKVDYVIKCMSNGVWTKEGREKHWIVKQKHDPSAPEFFLKEKDLQKLFDNDLLN